MGESIRVKALKSKTFCIFPFTHLATKTEGSFKLCCRSDDISSLKETSAIELWNSDKYKKIRRQFLNNEKPEECKACWSLEKFGTRSMRQRSLNNVNRFGRYLSLLKKVKEDGTVPFLPKSIELKLSNLCNLRCRMCQPVNSSSLAKEWPLVSDLMKTHNAWVYKVLKKQDIQKNPFISAFNNNKKWWNDFDQLVDSLDVIEFAGGEPLIDPLHYKTLDLLMRRSEKIDLKYSTNLTRLTFKGRHIFDYWKNFKSVSVYASIDGINKVYDYIRTDANFEKVDSNLNEIIQNQEVCFKEVCVACTIQVYNAFQLPQVIDYFSKKKIKLHSHRVTYPSFLSVQVLPQYLKDQLTEDLIDYQERFNKEGFFEESVIHHLNLHIRDHLNHMNGKDMSHLIPFLKDYTQKLDQSRKTDIFSIIPELKDVFNKASKWKTKARRPFEVFFNHFLR